MSKDIKPVDGHSLDITEHNIEQLKRLFPNIFTEGKIDFDALKSELGEYIESSDERYQFTWAGKEQAKRIATTPSLGTLRPVPEESVEWDTTENLYIEGDNLEVLKLLQKSYFNKVKMIYIDPPYNTGNDFVYKDDFKDNLANYQRLTDQLDAEGNPLSTNRDSAGRYHSNWLNMMYPRLKLARNLLCGDGVIFISIDDNEVHNLRKICDEVFGSSNFVAQFVWSGKSGSEDDKNIRNNHEYCLSYCKSASNFEAGLDIKDDINYPFYDSQKKEHYKRQLLRKWGDNSKREDRPNLYYPIRDDAGNDFYPTLPSGEDGCWRWGKDRMQAAVKEGLIEFDINRAGQTEAYEKIYESDNRRRYKKFQSLITSASSTSNGTKELGVLFQKKKVFDRPKPVAYLGHLINISSLNTDDLVLDFFSGSSTTAHAVMELNAKDSGNRKFIMVQIPEPTPENSEARKAGYDTIAEIGKERIRRAAAKIREEHPDTEVDLGFKVLKLDTSNIKKWQPEIETIADDLIDAVDNIHTERTPADLLYEVLLKYGLPLTLPVEEIKLGEHTAFNVAMGSLVACFDENISLETVQDIIELSSEDSPVLRVVFRDNSFKDDIVKTNAIQRLKQAGIDDILSI